MWVNGVSPHSYGAATLKTYVICSGKEQSKGG